MKVKLNLLTAAIICIITSPVFAENPSYYVPSSTVDDYGSGGKYNPNTNAGIYNINQDKYHDTSSLLTPYDGPSSSKKSEFLVKMSEKYPAIKNALKNGRSIDFSSLSNVEKRNLMADLGKAGLFSSTSDTMFSYAYNQAIQQKNTEMSDSVNKAIWTAPLMPFEIIQFVSKIAVLSGEASLDAVKVATGADFKANIAKAKFPIGELKSLVLFFNEHKKGLNVADDVIQGEILDAALKDGAIEYLTDEKVQKLLKFAYDLEKAIADGAKNLNSNEQKEVSKLVIDLTFATTKFVADVLPPGPLSGPISGLLNYAGNIKDAIDVGNTTAEDFGKNLDSKTDPIFAEYDNVLNKILDDKLASVLLYNLNSSTPKAIDIFKVNSNLAKATDPCAVPDPPAPCMPVLPKVISLTTQGVNSHIGSAQEYMGTYKSGVAQQDVKLYSATYDAANTNNAKIKTGTEQTSLAQNTQAFDVLQDWTVTEGDQAKHFSIGDGFGSITAPDPNKPTIAALNNADVQQTTMTKVYKVPVGTKQVNVGMLANFVTNEYPEYVGSQYNDKATIEIKTGSGNIYQATLFDKELNSANFTAVSGLPSPMSGGGGQTGFEQLNKTINVANGGNLTITVKTANVGDMAVPSATLINATSVK
jgi:hypothetical protein